MAREYGRVVVALSLMCGSRQLAEDAVQEALARAAAISANGERIENLAAWVTVVARNVARGGLRRLRAELRAKSRYTDAARTRQHHAGSLDPLEVAQAVRSLRPRQREAIALYYFADLPIRDVAMVMKLHPEAVKGLLARGRTALALALRVEDETFMKGDLR